MKSNNFRRFPGSKDGNGKWKTLGGAAGRPDRKVTKQTEAAERKAVWDALSDVQKLKELKLRPGNSTKQIARIKAGQVKQDQVKAPKDK
jgi:hypothetical protein